MRSLTILQDNRRVKHLDEILAFEKEMQIEFPSILRQVLLKYEGCATKEYIYFRKGDHSNKFDAVSQFLFLRDSNGGGASIEAIYKGHQFYGIRGFIPFAIDAGGWDYCVSIKTETFGQIWVDEFDAGEEDPFRFVASSMEELIGGMITFEEAVKLGY